jgi:hypothetical protein
LTRSNNRRIGSRIQTGQAGNGGSLTTEEEIEAQVLEKLILQTLMEQHARLLNLSVPPAELQTAYKTLLIEFQSEQAFEVWLSSNNLDDRQLQDALKSELVAAKLFEFVTQQIPNRVDQVKVVYLWVTEDAVAEEVSHLLNQGQPFTQVAEALAQKYPDGFGYNQLSWFPAQAAFLPEAVETEVFQAQTNDLIGPIESSGKYYFVHVKEQATDLQLAPDRESALKQHYFSKWLHQKRSEAQIEKFITLN